MDVATYLHLAQVLLRILEASPALIAACEAFWRTVTSNPGAPEHIEAAVQAAFSSIRDKAASTGAAG